MRLHTRRHFDATADVYAPWRHLGDSIGNIVRSEPSRKNKRPRQPLSRHIAQKSQLKRRPTSPILRGVTIEQPPCCIVIQPACLQQTLRCIQPRRSYPEGLQIPLPMCPALFHRLIPMKLQQVRMHGVLDSPDLIRRGIHKQRHQTHKRRNLPPQLRSPLNSQIALALWIENETNGIRTCLYGSRNVFFSGQATDLDSGSHGNN